MELNYFFKGNNSINYLPISAGNLIDLLAEGLGSSVCEHSDKHLQNLLKKASKSCN